MDLALVSVVADTAAAFGVIGSLVFVGFQVRQNNTGLHQSAVQAQMAVYTDLFSNVVDSEQMAEIWWQGLQDPANLEGTRRVRFYAYSSKFFRVYQGLHWQWRRGAIDHGLFNSITKLMEDFALAPGWRHMWRERRHQYDADFQQYMDAMMEKDEGKPLYPELVAENG
jgi:hypothetical protein